MNQQMSPADCYAHGLVLKRVSMFDQAIDDFRKAARDPDYAGQAHVQIALCLKAAGRHEEAVMSFRQAVVLPTLSAEERRHIHYHMGQILELLDRQDESREIYERIQKEAPGFRDVAQRIKHLSAGRGGLLPQSCSSWDGWVDEVKTRSRQWKPQVEAFLEQTGQWLSRQASSLKGPRLFGTAGAGFMGAGARQAQPSRVSNRSNQSAMRGRGAEKRRHARVPVRLRGHFATKGRAMTGEGELRDLSLWGCRVTSPVAIPVGTDLECCIFPQDAANPFIVDGATVRWISSHEFGLAFTRIRPGVQRQIAQLCRAPAA